MTCHEVREQLAISSRGGTSLTEWALAHAHVTQCAECQAERASFPLALGVGPSPIRLAIAARAACETTRTELTRVLSVLTRLRVLTASSLVVPPARAAAGLVERARFAGARSARGLARFGTAGTMAGHGAARAAGQEAGAVLGLVGRSLGGTVRVAGREVGTCGLGATQTRAGLVQVGKRLPSLVAASVRAVGHTVGTIPDRARAHPTVCAGMVSAVVLVSSLLFLGPRLRPDDLFSPDEPLSRDARLPVDRKPVEPIVIRVSPPRPAPAPQSIPAPRVTAPETHGAIPAPVRRSDRAAVEATPTAEASDPGAAIDWLLQGSTRRRAESP